MRGCGNRIIHSICLENIFIVFAIKRFDFLDFLNISLPRRITRKGRGKKFFKVKSLFITIIGSCAEVYRT